MLIGHKLQTRQSFPVLDMLSKQNNYTDNLSFTLQTEN